MSGSPSGTIPRLRGSAGDSEDEGGPEESRA